ncbi:MAG: hypothetical protein EOP06_24200 [Proteobacteria bacterium]|nr:MAG: hypothetical protein EOP06_24200 [Pseudomonadota bacterium]
MLIPTLLIVALFLERFPTDVVFTVGALAKGYLFGLGIVSISAFVAIQLAWVPTGIIVALYDRHAQMNRMMLIYLKCAYYLAMLFAFAILGKFFFARLHYIEWPDLLVGFIAFVEMIFVVLTTPSQEKRVFYYRSLWSLVVLGAALFFVPIEFFNVFEASGASEKEIPLLQVFYAFENTKISSYDVALFRWLLIVTSVHLVFSLLLDTYLNRRARTASSKFL